MQNSEAVQAWFQGKMASFRILGLISKDEIRSGEFSFLSRSLRVKIISLDLVSMPEIGGNFFSVSSWSLRVSVRNSRSRLDERDWTGETLILVSRFKKRLSLTTDSNGQTIVTDTVKKCNQLAPRLSNYMYDQNHYSHHTYPSLRIWIVDILKSRDLECFYGIKKSRIESSIEYRWFIFNRKGAHPCTSSWEPRRKVSPRARKSDFWKSISKAAAQGALNRLYPPCIVNASDVLDG